jgi:hypothetical protein
LVFNPGNATTLISGHELDTSTVGSDKNLDVRLLDLFDAPDNVLGEFAIVEVIINKHRGHL